MSVAKIEKRTEVKAKIKLEAEAILKNIKKFGTLLFLGRLYNILNSLDPVSFSLEKRRKKEKKDNYSYRKEASTLKHQDYLSTQ